MTRDEPLPHFLPGPPTLYNPSLGVSLWLDGSAEYGRIGNSHMVPPRPALLKKGVLFIVETEHATLLDVRVPRIAGTQSTSSCN
jgi:hypothetical protein